jgi:hypothetical protein
MYRLTLALAVAAGCFVQRPLPAAVISRDWKTPGDGLLTYDDVNKREWLDLSQTVLSQFPGATREDKFQYVVSQLPPGGLFGGFSVAKSNDVSALAVSAGINISVPTSPANVIPVLELGALFSFTIDTSSPTGTKVMAGLLDEFDPPPSSRRTGAVFAVEFAATPDRAGLQIHGDSDILFNPLPAVYLVRSVPEPTTFLASLLGWAGFPFLRRSRTRRLQPRESNLSRERKGDGRAL